MSTKKERLAEKAVELLPELHRHVQEAYQALVFATPGPDLGAVRASLEAARGLFADIEDAALLDSAGTAWQKSGETGAVWPPDYEKRGEKR